MEMESGIEGKVAKFENLEVWKEGMQLAIDFCHAL